MRSLGISEFQTLTLSCARDLKPVPRRLEPLVAGGITIIDDAFNANPLSMKLALHELASTASPGRRRVAILSTMRELDADNVRYHEKVGTYARAQADLLIGVGEHATDYQPRPTRGRSGRSRLSASRASAPLRWAIETRVGAAGSR